MFLSRITFTPDRLRCKDLAVHHDLFREHQMIWNLFDNRPDTSRDFLYRREDQPGSLPFYYLLSAREPRYPNGLRIETKLFEPIITNDDLLAFSLRANAVITRKPGDGSKRRIRRDIIEARSDYYKTNYPDPSDRPAPPVIHQEAAEIWWNRQGEQHGFEPLELRVDNHRFHKMKKNGDNNQRRFTSLDFYGRIRVTNADLFKQALINGLGRSKAFGCGLLLVRRI